MSNGLLTVLEDINYVLVENRPDAEFYTMAYRKFLAASFLRAHGSRLIFTPVGVKVVSAEVLEKLIAATTTLESKGADKSEIQKLREVAKELKERNDVGGGCSQIKQRVTVSEYKMEVNRLGVITKSPEEIKGSHQPEMIWGLLDGDVYNKAEGSIYVLDVYSFENYLCMPLNLFYLMKNDAVMTVKKRHETKQPVDPKDKKRAEDLSSTADKISDLIEGNKHDELRKLLIQITSYVITQLIERINAHFTTKKGKSKNEKTIAQEAHLKILIEGLQGDKKPLTLANGLVIEDCPTIFFEGILGGRNGHKIFECIGYLMFGGKNFKHQMQTRIFGACDEIPAALLPKSLLIVLNNLSLSNREGDTKSSADEQLQFSNSNTTIKSAEEHKNPEDLKNAFNQFYDNNYWYKQPDINLVGSILFKNLKHVKFIGAIGEFDRGIASSIHDALFRRLPVVGIFNTANFKDDPLTKGSHWIAFLMKYNWTKQTWTLYEKDSLNIQRNNLKLFLKSIGFDCEAGGHHNHKEQIDSPPVQCGIFALMNAVILAGLTDTQLRDFNSVPFYTPTEPQAYNNELATLRRDFAGKYIQGQYLHLVTTNLEDASRKRIKPSMYSIYNKSKIALYKYLNWELVLNYKGEEPLETYHMECQQEAYRYINSKIPQDIPKNKISVGIATSLLAIPLWLASTALSSSYIAIQNAVSNSSIVTLSAIFIFSAAALAHYIYSATNEGMSITFNKIESWVERMHDKSIFRGYGL